ncbi:ABC-three component system middle component 1 [Peribacillus simplex]
MDSTIVIQRLTNNYDYSEVFFDDQALKIRLRERNLEVWENDKKCMVTKEYTSKAQLSSWFIDQIIISFVYDSIQAKYRNNLYFLLIINLKEEEENSFSNLINEIEKDNKVCRKYVIRTLDDLKRVPSLNDNFGQSNNKPIDFDSEFKKNLFEESNEDEVLSKRVKDIVDLYFKFYDASNENKQEAQINLISQILVNGVSENEN